jgi:hypothetical protein
VVLVTVHVIFAFAGIWRPTEEGKAYAFLTCEPNPLVAQRTSAIHLPIQPSIEVFVVEDDRHCFGVDGIFRAGLFCSVVA